MRWITLLGLSGLFLGACGEAPCTRDNDCGAGEMCSMETCVPRNTGSDGGRVDPDAATEDAGTAGGEDAGPTPDGGTPDAGAPDAGGADDLPEHLWDFVMSAPGGFDQARSLAVDATGGVILSGPFSGAPSVDGTEYASRGESDIYVLRLTAEGAVDWIQTFGSTEADSCRGVTTDAAGNIYLTGQYQGEGVSVGGGPELAYEEGDGKNIFVASLTAAGAHRWSVGYTGPGTDSGNSIAVVNEQVYVAGFFTETASLPDGTVTSAGGRDIVLLNLDRAGALRWQRTYGGAGEDGAWDVAVADNDKAYVAGYFAETLTFGGLGSRTALAAVGSTDLFVLKINEEGEERHLAAFGAADGSATGRSIAITESRGALVGGLFTGTLALPGVTPTADDSDGVVLRLNNELELQWHQTLGGSGTARVLGVAYGAEQQAFGIGQFSGELQGLGETVSAVGEQDVFVVALGDDDGGLAWTRTWGSAGGDWGWGAEVHADRLLTSGAMRGDVDFGGGSRSFSDGDAYVVAHRVR